jgi:hypothetical protein
MIWSIVEWKEQPVNVIDQAVETQLSNIRKKTGLSLDQLFESARSSGLTRHSEIRDFLKASHGLGFGDANTLTHVYLKSLVPAAEAPASSAEILDQIYAGPKAELRPIHDRLMAAIEPFGAFEVSPKKGYVSLRRKKQFATIGPASRTRIEVGLNMKGVEPSSRLQAIPPGGMCQYKISVTTVDEVDRELTDWIRVAYDSAG